MTESSGSPKDSVRKTAERKRRMDKDWEYYNHALIPTTAPHVTPDTSWMKDRKKWRELADGRHPLFARWTTDFDCQEETQWWYCIKDDLFDLSSLKYKRRRVINQGLQWVEVKLIMPCEFSEQMAEIQLAARLGYGEILDIEAEKEALIQEFASVKDPKTMGNREFTGAFLRETGEMIGYGIYEIYKDWVDQSVIKTHPDYLKYNVNAALVYFAVERYMGDEFSVKYISNGSKNIFHKTNYHDYLIKYFGFRKVYCRLHIRYCLGMGIIVKVLYPFRRFFSGMTEHHLFRQASAILYMEEIHRTFDRK